MRRCIAGGTLKVGIVDVYDIRCGYDGCSKGPHFGGEGSSAASYRGLEGKESMLVFLESVMANRACGKQLSFVIVGGKAALCFRQDPGDCVAGVVNKLSGTEVSSKRPKIGVEGSKAVSYCRQLAEDGLAVVIRRLVTPMHCLGTGALPTY